MEYFLKEVHARGFVVSLSHYKIPKWKCFFIKQFQNIRYILSPLLLLFVFVNIRQILQTYVMFCVECFNYLHRLEILYDILELYFAGSDLNAYKVVKIAIFIFPPIVRLGFENKTHYVELVRKLVRGILHQK